MSVHQFRRASRAVPLAVFLLAVVSGALLSGCRSYDQETYSASEVSLNAPISGPYRIVAGDTLAIGCQDRPELNTSVLVRPDGFVTVPYIGELSVAGRTVSGVRKSVLEGLTGKVPISALWIDVSLFATREVFVIGEVNSPGIMPMPNRRLTLLEAITRAGGYNPDTADLSKVVFVRDEEDGRRVAWLVDMEPVVTARVPPQPIYLRPGDIVLVPDCGVVQANRFIDRYITRMIPGIGAFSTLALGSGSLGGR